MHQVEVDLVEAEPLEAEGQLSRGVAPARVELRRYEHLVAGDATVAEALANAALVAVELGGVDVPVPELERPAHRVFARRSVGYLPNAQAEHGHLAAVRQHVSAAVGRKRYGSHGVFSLFHMMGLHTTLQIRGAPN